MFKKGFDKMNLEEYKKHVNEVNNNIENLLKDNEEELSFYQLLVNAFNQVCKERNNLEQALDEIENILNGVGEMACYSKSIYLDGEDIEDILEIIKKAKGDVKNEK